MQERVQAFLFKQDIQKKTSNEIYQYYVLEYADLLTNQYGSVPVTPQEYYNTPASERAMEDGVYYAQKRLPLEVSYEEFSAVASAIPADVIADLKYKAYDINISETEEKSYAASFFTVLAWILWIGGLIISIIGGKITKEVSGLYSTSTVTEFNFTVFMSVYIIYLISGAFCLCAAELFKKLQTIVNLLRRKA